MGLFSCIFLCGAVNFCVGFGLACFLGYGPPTLRDAWRGLSDLFERNEDLELLDYRVRVFQGGTDAVTRVLIEFGDGGDTWSTVGVSGNVIDASFQALVDGIVYRLVKLGVPAQ